MRIQIAWRNVLRNGRRTALNILMIAGGISAIVVFHGFSHNLISKLETVAVDTQYGNLQIANDKTWHLSAQDSPVERLLRPTPQLKDTLARDPRIDYASGRLSFYGLISGGEQSLSARGLGFDIDTEKRLREQTHIIEGKNFSPGAKFEVLFGSGLRDQMGLAIGSNVTLMAYTYDGAVNALDATLVGIFQTGLAEVDNGTFFVPLATAQRLLGTDAVERMVLRLKPGVDQPTVRADLEKTLPPGTAMRSWQELATYYRQVVEYYNIQNFIIEWILMLLALLAIANTVGMSISERVGEIGTVRALGDTQADVLKQFLVEGLILGLLGGVAGCVGGFLCAGLLTALHIPITIPGASIQLMIDVDILPSAFFQAFAMTCAMAILATFLPAYRASRLQIVQALRRNL